LASKKSPAQSGAEGERRKTIYGAAIGNPVRVRCLARMAEAPTSPSAIAYELGLTSGKVAHHVKVLEECGLVVMVDQRPVRGAVKNFFETVVLPDLDEEKWAELDDDARAVYIESILSLYSSDAAFALEKETFYARDDFQIGRTAMKVDEQGWSDLRDTFEQVAARVAEIKVEADARLEAAAAEKADGATWDQDDDGAPVWVLAFHSLFEMPPRPRA
jgi:DNA-binding transcriptional ArsR family regulator